jgi:steroid 5-alpha reductase family enzyme
MTPIQSVVALTCIAASLSLVMSLAWILQQRTGNSGWVDACWSIGVGFVGLVSALFPLSGEGPSARQVVVGALAALWALRLGVHIGQRSAATANDPRYAKLSEDWGSQAPWRMFIFLQLQAFVSVALVGSVFFAAHNPAPLQRAQDFAAVAILLIAVFGEGLADRQLKQFKADAANKGSINDRGLWGWTRHPNYFFETLGWVSYPLLAINLSYSWGWLALAAPACMYWLLVYVSGIPPLEEHMLRTRGDAFRAYQRRTNAFFPAPPRPAS